MIIKLIEIEINQKCWSGGSWMSKSNENNKLSIIFKVTFMVGIIFIFLVSVFTYKEHMDFKKNIAKNQQELSDIIIEGVQRNLEEQFSLLQVGLEPIINNQQIKTAFKERDRERLAAYTVATMNGLEKLGVQQYQFHLPDNSSFFRVHMPNEYGDDLSQFRHTVVEANAQQKIIQGLEGGVAGAGFRYVVPINFEGSHIGTVELGMGFHQGILANFKSQYQGEWYISSLDGHESSFIMGTAEEVVATNLTENQRAELSAGQSIHFTQDKYLVHLIPLADYTGHVKWYITRVYDNTDVISIGKRQVQESLIFGIITIVIGLGVLTVALRYVLNPLTKIKEQLEQLAEKGGDLTQQLEVNTNDEVGFLAIAVNKFLANLRSIIENIKQSADNTVQIAHEMADGASQTGVSAEQVANATSELAIGTNAQSKHANDVLQQMKSIGEKVEAGNKQLESSVANARNSTKVAQEGKESINKAIDQLATVTRTVEFATDSIQKLGQRSNEIGEIVSIITNISNQTNMLALNAAIEAARAGEQGKGFAVVANEVGKLAEQSGNAADSITNLIKDIQAETSVTVHTMESNLEAVNLQVDIIKKGGEALEKIVAGVEQTEVDTGQLQDIFREIKANTDKVQNALTEVSAIIEESAASSQEVAASAEEQSSVSEEMAASASQLAELAEQLKKEVDKFTT